MHLVVNNTYFCKICICLANNRHLLYLCVCSCLASLGYFKLLVPPQKKRIKILKPPGFFYKPGGDVKGRDTSGLLRGWAWWGVQPCQAFHQSLKKASPESCAPGCRCRLAPGWLGGKRPKAFWKNGGVRKNQRPQKMANDSMISMAKRFFCFWGVHI